MEGNEKIFHKCLTKANWNSDNAMNAIFDGTYNHEMMAMPGPVKAEVSKDKINKLFDNYKEDSKTMYNTGCTKFFNDIGIAEVGD